MRTRLVTLAILLALADPAAARAHAALGAGSFAEAIAPDLGVWLGAEYWPGGLWGARLDGYLVHVSRSAVIEASVARLLGDARPHLAIAGHLGAGWETAGHAVTISGGLATLLGLRIGPLAVGLDATVHTAIARHHVGLLVTGVLALEAAF